MQKEEFENQIKEYAKEIDILLNQEQINQFYLYMQILLEWNEKINLTAITKPEEIILKHFVDSITIAKYLKSNAKIIDVGTGAGFPGIPIKIIREDIQVTLLDSLNKRINFLNEIIEKLELVQIQTIHNRAEEAGKSKKYRENFDIATSRAVANLSTLAEYLLPFVKQGGQVIAMKGATIEEELEASQKAIKVLGGKIKKIDTFCLPKSDIDRNVIILQKEKTTPAKYPRKPGTPAKEPIK